MSFEEGSGIEGFSGKSPGQNVGENDRQQAEGIMGPPQQRAAVDLAAKAWTNPSHSVDVQARAQHTGFSRGEFTMDALDSGHGDHSIEAGQFGEAQAESPWMLEQIEQIKDDLERRGHVDYSPVQEMEESARKQTQHIISGSGEHDGVLSVSGSLTDTTVSSGMRSAGKESERVVSMGRKFDSTDFGPAEPGSQNKSMNLSISTTVPLAEGLGETATSSDPKDPETGKQLLRKPLAGPEKQILEESNLSGQRISSAAVFIDPAMKRAEALPEDGKSDRWREEGCRGPSHAAGQQAGLHGYRAMDQKLGVPNVDQDAGTAF